MDRSKIEQDLKKREKKKQEVERKFLSLENQYLILKSLEARREDIAKRVFKNREDAFRALAAETKEQLGFEITPGNMRTCLHAAKIEFKIRQRAGLKAKNPHLSEKQRRLLLKICQWIHTMDESFKVPEWLEEWVKSLDYSKQQENKE